MARGGPAVGIVVPAYNARPFVAEAVASVLGQRDRDLELLVWDDGSTDGTAEAAEAAIGADPRGRVVRAGHQGLTRSLRDAYAQCRGRLLGQCDADDRLHPDAVAACRARLRAVPRAGFVYTRHRVIDDAGRDRGVGKRGRLPFDRNRMLLDFLTFHFRLYRRRAFEAAGGWDVGYERAQDYDLCLRLSEVAPVAHLPRPLYDYRVHARSVSHTAKPRQVADALRAVNAALSRRGEAGRFRVVADARGKFRLVGLG